MSYSYRKAKARVDAEPELAKHRAAILPPWWKEASWKDDEHWRWVCEAPVPEIVEWAKIREDPLLELCERMRLETDAIETLAKAPLNEVAEALGLDGLFGRIRRGAGH